MNQSKRKRVHTIRHETWTVEQDAYLIEHSTESLLQLAAVLPYNEEQILARKKQLGLLRRARQMRAFK